MSTKAQRIEKVRIRAWEYARSGGYRDWYSIELALRQQGLDEARSELDSKSIRDELDSICKVAQAAKQLNMTYEQGLRETQGGSAGQDATPIRWACRFSGVHGYPCPQAR
jgi:hypothetical protein